MKKWSRIIACVDMNAYFAAVEQLDYPKLRGKPVAVTNGRQGSCIITSSYEARRYGVKTGMRLWEGKKLCPDLIQCPSRPQRYVQISTKIMKFLQDKITPDIEVFSVDEAFLDMSRVRSVSLNAWQLGNWIKQSVYTVSGLTASVGISGDKTTAKYASKLKKPNGVVVIPPYQAAQTLAKVAVTELCGISAGIAGFLAQYQIYTCGDMQRLPISVLSKRFGNIGRRIWYMCHGADPEPVKVRIQPAKSMGHGKILPPNTRCSQLILTYLRHMSEKLAMRLRRHELRAKRYYIGLRCPLIGWIEVKQSLACPSQDGLEIFHLCKSMMRLHWHGQVVQQVQVTALDLQQHYQLDLFALPPSSRDSLNQTVDVVNHKYGQFTLMPASLLSRTESPDVISPAWQPDGYRQSGNVE